MERSITPPRLRLVGSDEDHRIRAWAVDRAARDAVAAENDAASTNPVLTPTDPRWVLAVRTSTQLQGTMLTPERRDRILALARTLGVRPFDASMIIAIVQDHARAGLGLDAAAGTLALLRRPGVPRPRPWIRWVAALGAAIVVHAFLVWWLLSG